MPEGEGAPQPEGAGQDGGSETIRQLKDLFSQQMQEMREQNEATVRQLSETIEQLRKDNASLQAAVVRSASMDPPRTEPQKTEQEIYREQVEALRDRALEIYKARGNYR